MEQSFRINWTAIVAEAKQRRKKLKITQIGLASIAKVSTPTISNFENGDESVQISSAMLILEALGMVDRREISFIQANQIYDNIGQVVVFYGKSGEKSVKCQIGKEALDDYFGDKKTPLRNFQDNHEIIEHIARKKYLNGKFENDGSLLIKTMDLI